MKKVKNYDKKCKIILLGDSSVGKSQLLMRFCHSKYDSLSKPTVGVEYACKMVPVSNEETEDGGVLYKAQIWDTAGQEKYNSMINAYYRNTDGVVLVIDSSLPPEAAFKRTSHWMDQVSTKIDSSNLPIIFVALNKIDEEALKKTSLGSLQDVEAVKGLRAFETSALTGENVDLLFTEMVAKIHEKGGVATEMHYGCSPPLRVGGGGAHEIGGAGDDAMKAAQNLSGQARGGGLNDSSEMKSGDSRVALGSGGEGGTSGCCV